MALNNDYATGGTSGTNKSGAVSIMNPININNNYVFNWNINDTNGAWDIRHNGIIKKTGNGSAYYNATIAKDLFLFARGGGNTTATSSNTKSDLDVPFKGRIYYVKIWNGLPENNDIAHYLVPIRLMPGNLALQRYGFIDKVTNKMYFSSTSVEFTGG